MDAAEVGAPWPCTQPAWVFSSGQLPKIDGADSHFVQGDLARFHAEMREAAGGMNLWVVGGGDLAGQFYDAGLLDELVIQVGAHYSGWIRDPWPREAIVPSIAAQPKPAPGLCSSGGCQHGGGTLRNASWKWGSPLMSGMLPKSQHALSVALRNFEPGMTTRELDSVGERLLERRGARSAPKLTCDFPGSTCISVNQEAAHGIPGDRVIRPGDVLNVDVSAELGGYFADTGGTKTVPPTNPQKARLCHVTHLHGT